MYRLYLQTPNIVKILGNEAKRDSFFAVSNENKQNPSKQLCAGQKPGFRRLQDKLH